MEKKHCSFTITQNTYLNWLQFWVFIFTGVCILWTCIAWSHPENALRILENKPKTDESYHIEKIEQLINANDSVCVIIHLSKAHVPAVIRREGEGLKVLFPHSVLSSLLKSQYNIGDLQRSLRFNLLIEKGAGGSPNIIRLLNLSKKPYRYLARQENNLYIIDLFSSKQTTAKAKFRLQDKKNTTQNDIQDTKPDTSHAISLNFQDIPVRAVLQKLADFTGINMVVSDAVTGNITLRLEDTPWEQALDLIMQTKGLARRIEGNVMRIAPVTEWKQAAANRSDFSQLASGHSKAMHAELFQIRYAKAADIAGLLKDKDTHLLSKKASLNVDVRTNTLWIKDSPARIAEIAHFIHQRDVAIKQVLIEARIVNVNQDFARDLGVSWGLTNLDDSIDSNVMEQSRPNRHFASRLHMDLGAEPVGTKVASMGLAFARLSDNILLDLELSALESEGRGEIIASPRLITMNQQPALIQSGEEVPYQESTTSGATSVAFKKAVLSLEVKPEITPDGKILMELQINQDRLSTQKYNGVPAILTKAIKTSVFVKNGETIVLGGIYKQEQGSSIERVPFLGNLPIVGHLFKKENRVKLNEELLIFITPKIITDSNTFL